MVDFLLWVLSVLLASLQPAMHSSINSSYSRYVYLPLRHTSSISDYLHFFYWAVSGKETPDFGFIHLWKEMNFKSKNKAFKTSNWTVRRDLIMCKSISGISKVFHFVECIFSICGLKTKFKTMKNPFRSKHQIPSSTT